MVKEKQGFIVFVSRKNLKHRPFFCILPIRALLFFNHSVRRPRPPSGQQAQGGTIYDDQLSDVSAGCPGAELFPGGGDRLCDTSVPQRPRQAHRGNLRRHPLYPQAPSPSDGGGPDHGALSDPNPRPGGQHGKRTGRCQRRCPRHAAPGPARDPRQYSDSPDGDNSGSISPMWRWKSA